MDWVSIVKKIINGEAVDADVINPILAALADRDQFLYERIASYEDKSVLIGYDLLVDPEASISVNDVVYYKPEAGLNLATVSFNNGSEHFTPGNESFAFGIVKSLQTVSDENKADVYMQGIVDVDVEDLLVDGEAFQAGPLYLSKSVAGRLTSKPGGLAIFIGYALSAEQMLLHPNYDSLNQLFFNYRFDLIDRPAGIPVLGGGAWTISSADITKVGWIPADDSPLAALKPDGALFYYNIPSEDDVNADVSLTDEEKSESIVLAQSLPAYPVSTTMLFVNGILQHQYNGTDGIYMVNQAGIWWFNDTDTYQPWASDIVDDTITFNSGTDKVLLTAHGLIDGDQVSFVSSGTLPNNLALNTVYYVVNKTNDDFQISLTEGGDVVDIGSGGSGTHMLSWLTNKGSTPERARTSIHFVRLNPDYKTAVVSSLKPYIDETVDSSKSLVMINAADRLTEKPTGDLLYKFKITNSSEEQATVTKSAVKSVSFNNLTGELEVETGNVITGIEGKGGISVTVADDGYAVVSLTNYTLRGDVTDIEPEDATYVYRGLHGYLRLRQPANNTAARVGLVGHIPLGEDLPAGKNLKLKILGFGSTTSSNSAKFKFEYSVSQTGLVSDAVLKTNSGADISVGPFVANTASEITNTYFEVPADALKSNSVVNFRIARVYNADYAGDFNILNIKWVIE